MKKRILWLILFIGVFSSQVKCVETPRHILRIVEQLKCELPEEGTFICSSLNVNRSLYVERSGEAIIQIGLRLFTASMREDLDIIVCNSVERIFLELALAQNVQKQKALLKEYRVSLLYNGFLLGTVQFPSIEKALEVFTEDASLSLTSERGKITLRVRSNDDAVVITLPSDRELLFAYDKKEHEELLREELAAWKGWYVAPNMKPEVSDLQQVEGGCYVFPGEAYMIDSLRSDIFYSMKNNVAHVLFDRNIPLKSLQNVLMGYVGTEYVNLHVRYRMYERNEAYCTMPLSEFQGYMQAQGLNFYSAAYYVKPDEVQCLLLMHHPLYDYVHMLIVQHNPALFDKKKVTLEGDFYTFIPQHNIKSLFNF